MNRSGIAGLARNTKNLQVLLKEKIVRRKATKQLTGISIKNQHVMNLNQGLTGNLKHIGILIIISPGRVKNILHLALQIQGFKRRALKVTIMLHRIQDRVKSILHRADQMIKGTVNLQVRVASLIPNLHVREITAILHLQGHQVAKVIPHLQEVQEVTPHLQGQAVAEATHHLRGQVVAVQDLQVVAVAAEEEEDNC